MSVLKKLSYLLAAGMAAATLSGAVFAADEMSTEAIAERIAPVGQVYTTKDLEGIATAAAMVAAVMVPGVKAFFIAGHRSAEPAHDRALEWLGLSPLLDLGMRLGEGTGAALAMPVVEAAAGVLAEMATFAEAGVSLEDA